VIFVGTRVFFIALRRNDLGGVYILVPMHCMTASQGWLRIAPGVAAEMTVAVPPKLSSVQLDPTD